MVALALTASLGWFVSPLQPGDTTQTANPAAEPTGSATLGAVPDEEVDRIHTAVHDIGARSPGHVPGVSEPDLTLPGPGSAHGPRPAGRLWLRPLTTRTTRSSPTLAATGGL